VASRPRRGCPIRSCVPSPPTAAGRCGSAPTAVELTRLENGAPTTSGHGTGSRRPRGPGLYARAPQDRPTPGSHPGGGPFHEIHEPRRAPRRHDPGPAVDRDQSLWIATFGGLNRLREGRLKRIGVRDGSPAGGLLPVRGPRGSLWIRTIGGGLVRLRDGAVTTFTGRVLTTCEGVLSPRGACGSPPTAASSSRPGRRREAPLRADGRPATPSRPRRGPRRVSGREPGRHPRLGAGPRAASTQGRPERRPRRAIWRPGRRAVGGHGCRALAAPARIENFEPAPTRLRPVHLRSSRRRRPLVGTEGTGPSPPRGPLACAGRATACRAPSCARSAPILTAACGSAPTTAWHA
jgi:hypothetical protein